ncbi:hypothetical protein [Cupriavidus sp. AcVe19-6a]|uniref:hypothetical protein n=1 Tax=Cupriavidus sp. AcVe19-6a TaxID=2821358 RepID=UPI001AE2314C|nr:hypothetical protein [Cupriavidus sp. AcVe19-6a]MBP0639901.1 hypothetical protein [Cupriavidus sp. AcVe19-6a]
MSFDIIVLRPSNPDAESLDSVRDANDLGDLASVRRGFDSIFPGATTGVFLHNEEYALEVSLAGDPVGSAHIALRFGAAWSDASHDQFVERLGELCRRLQCVAFAVSDNARLGP